MEDPPREITEVIHLLTQSPPALQQLTIERYFALDAAFTHPFCRTGSFTWNPSLDLGPLGRPSHYSNSRWLIKCVYRWYKIMSPKIQLEIDSVAYDRENLILYISLHQVFHIFLLPRIFTAPVHLTTVLQLTPTTAYSHASYSEPQHTKYLIQSQNDLYQTSEFFKFFSILRIAWAALIAWQFFATAACVVGQWVFWPISRWEEGRIGRNLESRNEIEGHERDHKATAKTEVEKLD